MRDDKQSPSFHEVHQRIQLVARKDALKSPHELVPSTEPSREGMGHAGRDREEPHRCCPRALADLWSRTWAYQCRSDDCQRVSPRSCHIGTKRDRMGVAVFSDGPRRKPVDGSASLHIPFCPLWYSKNRHKRNALRHLHTRHHLRCRRPTPIRECFLTLVSQCCV